MINFLAPYKLPAIAVVIVVLLYGIYSLFAHERDIGFKQATAECTTKQFLAEVDARNKEAKFTKQIEEADRAGIILKQENEKLADALAIRGRKLRDTTTAMRNRLPTNSCETNRNTADAAITVFDECAREYSTMAENATGHASDVQRLEDRWPNLNAAH